MTERETQAQRNRALMPHVSEFVDKVREIFGPECKVSYAKEGGIELGKRLVDDGGPIIIHVWEKMEAKRRRGKA